MIFKSEMPPEIRRGLNGDARDITASGLLAARISGELNGRFGAEGIPILFLKGLTVSKLAYDDPFVKMSNDIDVLVPIERIEHAAKLLELSGYKLALPRARDLGIWHSVWKESIWVRADSPIIELHSRLADNRYLIPDIGNVSSRQDVEIAPGIALPTLADAELMAYLCVHAASSAWFRLKWVADIAAIMACQDLAQRERTISQALRLDAGRAIPATLLLVQKLFGTAAVPTAQLQVVSQKDRWLAELGFRELINDREPTERRIGTAAIHLCQFFLQPGAKFKASQFALQARKKMMPAE